MPQNQFLPIATGTGANALTYAQWAALGTLLAQGFQSGVVPSSQFNTFLRQLSVPVSGLAQLIADNQSQDVLDDGVPGNFEAKLKAALQNISAYVTQGGQSVFFTAGGTSTAYTGTLAPAPASLTPDMEVLGAFTTPNTAASPTLNLNGLGARPVLKQNGQPAQIGDLSGFVPLILNSAGSAWVINGLSISDITPPATPYTGQSLTNGGYYLVDVSQVTNFPLPNPATVPVGFKVRIKAINLPTGFQTSAVSVSAGSAPTALIYRGAVHTPFYLIGNGEGFWFENTGTAYDVLPAGQPAQVSIFGSNPSGSTNMAGAGSNQYLPITALSGPTAVFSTSTSVAAVNVPVSGDYQISASTKIYGSSSSYGSGAVTVADSTALTNIYDRTTASASNVDAGYPKSVFRQYLKQGSGVLAFINNPGSLSTDTSADTFAITFANR